MQCMAARLSPQTTHALSAKKCCAHCVGGTLGAIPQHSVPLTAHELPSQRVRVACLPVLLTLTFRPLVGPCHGQHNDECWQRGGAAHPQHQHQSLGGGLGLLLRHHVSQQAFLMPSASDSLSAGMQAIPLAYCISRNNLCLTPAMHALSLLDKMH